MTKENFDLMLIHMKYIFVYLCQLGTSLHTLGCRGRDLMVICVATMYAISAYHHTRSNPLMARGTRFNIVIKFVNDLRQVGGFLRVLRFPASIKLTATI